MSREFELIPRIKPVTTKLTEHDYQALLDRARVSGINQTSLIRLAVRRYLSETPTNEKTAS
ncbi:MAG: hypothetical protein H0U45_17150 [Tatlockia sp.]|nr:hypothetical protein [Tatlockia sp.]